MWRVVGASVRGSSHYKSGTPCQDFSAYRRTFIGNAPALLIGIADGAGSAKASEVGAEQSVQFILHKIATSLRNIHECTEIFSRSLFQDTRSHLDHVGGNMSLSARDLACTLLVAILLEDAAAFLQVGDGAWVVERAGGFDCMTWPSGGEYANQTTFITSPGWADVFQFRWLDGSISAVSGFTDGLQNVALRYSSRAAHGPFFESMLKAFRSVANETDLKLPLIEFLSSKRMTDRTDDDKSIVFACRDSVKLLCDVA